MPQNLNDMRKILEENVKALEAIVGADLTSDDLGEMLRQSDDLVLTLVQRVADFTRAIYRIQIEDEPEEAGVRKIAAIGDSITQGFFIDAGKYAYPAVLQSMLTPDDSTEPAYEVMNFGVSGRTALKDGDFPYWNEDAFQSSLEWLPDIAILMFGTNDSKVFQWDQDAYTSDYVDLIGHYQDLESNPDIYIMIPPPSYVEGAYNTQQHVINDIFPELIPQIAEQAGLDPEKNVIDIFAALGGKDLTAWNLMCDEKNCDNLHPA